MQGQGARGKAECRAQIRFSEPVAGGERETVVRVRRSRSARQKRGTTPRSEPRSARHHPSAYSSIMRTFSPTATVSSSDIDGANVCATAMLRGRRAGSRAGAPAEDDDDERRTWPAGRTACWNANEDVRAGDAGGGDASESAACGVAGVSASHVDLRSFALAARLPVFACWELPERYAGGGVVTIGFGAAVMVMVVGTSSVLRRTGAHGRTWGTQTASDAAGAGLRTSVVGRLASLSSDQPKSEPLLVLFRFSSGVPFCCWARFRTLQAQILHATIPARRKA
jgi:hypothetical protein